MKDMLEETAPAPRKELRPQQIKAIDMLRDSMRAGNRRVVLQAATGFGKTIIAARIIEAALERGKSVIFTCPMITIVDQTVAAFEAEGITGIGVMQANHPKADRFARVQVASVQTLARREIPQAAMVIVDEAHVRAKVIEAMMDERPDVFFVGLTATPWAKGMGLRWQDLVIPCTISDLIDAGYLSKFTAFAPDVPDLSKVKIKAGEFAEDQLAELMGDAKLMGNVVATWLEKGEGRPTLVFGVDRAHAGKLAQEFEAAGVAAAYVDGLTDSIERHRIGRKFRAGEVRVICSVRTMTTGVDLPVSCICDCAPTRSPSLHVQKIGRGLRVNPGTEDLIVLDHAGNSLRLGLVTDIHQDTLDKTKPGEKQKVEKAEKLPKPCSKCEALFQGKTCPACGHERKPFSNIAAADGELVEITGRKRSVATMAEKQRFWSMALWLDNARGKGGKLAKGLYKGRFDVWPKGLSDDPMPPDHAFQNYEHSRRIAYAKRMAASRGAAA